LAPETVVRWPVSSLLHIRIWDEECVVFDEASSTTHLITQPSGFLLEWTKTKPVTLACLVNKLNTLVTTDEQEDTQQFVLNTIQSFVTLGLLETHELSV